MSDIKETFKERFESEVAAWHAEDAERQEEIKQLMQRIEEYNEQIERDLDSETGATAETAAAQMNRDHAQARVNALKKEIAEHAPLYDETTYDAACDDIVAAYNEPGAEKLDEYITKLNEAHAALDDLNAIISEGAQCQALLDKACNETGFKANAYLGRVSVYGRIQGATKKTRAAKGVEELIRQAKM